MGPLSVVCHKTLFQDIYFRFVRLDLHHQFCIAKALFLVLGYGHRHWQLGAEQASIATLHQMLHMAQEKIEYVGLLSCWTHAALGLRWCWTQASWPWRCCYRCCWIGASGRRLLMCKGYNLQGRLEKTTKPSKNFTKRNDFKVPRSASQIIPPNNLPRRQSPLLLVK